MPVSLATGLEAAISKTRRSERLFESIGSQGEQLEPKWHSHFGNYIVNTLLALHKFQAKKQIYCLSYWCVLNVGLLDGLLGVAGIIIDS